ncbi:MAG: outer membrane protein assembly factor BamB [Planctomycetota bacterium]|jgi:outer membrane protein assembly factor BamB
MNATHLLFALLLPASLVAQADPEAAERVVLESAFEQLMSGCRMTGQFTETGSNKAPRKDSYKIARVKKLRDEKWQFDATIEYNGKSVTLPLAVDVYWAGDTPTIQVTDLNVPTLGRFNARIIVYDNQYAGMWSGKDHGGQMFGMIERDAVAGSAIPDNSIPDNAIKDNAIPDNNYTDTTALQGKGGSNWATWRGPNGTGEATGNPPTEWSEEKNIKWKVPLPGLGNSTPIVWQDRMYLTTAIQTDEEVKPAEAPAAEPRQGRRGGGRGNKQDPTKVFDFRVICLNRKDGTEIWNKSVKRAVPHEGGHATGSQASSSPITDGKRIYAHFGSRGIHCLSMSGDILWSKDLGTMRTRNQFGEGSSPALAGNALIINWDHEGDSFICALNAKTGKELWRKPRKEVTSWSTPVITKADGKTLAIVSATGKSCAYNVKNGDIVWSTTGMTTNAIPTPIVRDGIAYLMSGFRGASLQAIRLAGAEGDVTDGKNMLWKHSRQTSYVPSALLYGKYIYFVRSNNAVLSCIDIETGKPTFEGQRLAGLRTIYSSPVGAGDKVYLPSREGVTKVFRAGATYEDLATNELDDVFDASPVVIGDELYLRGHRALYCIGAK